MGNNQTDSYFLDEHNKVKTHRPYLYFWLDENVKARTENVCYLSILRESVSIQQFDHANSLINSIQQINNFEFKIFVISSSSLASGIYNYLQQSNKVNCITLFCASAQNGSSLMSKYPKIQNVCVKFQDLLEKIREAEVEHQEHIYYFNPKGVGLLNRWLVNWRVLVQANRAKGKQDFLRLVSSMNVATREQYKKYDKSYDISKNADEKTKLIVDWIELNNFYIRIVTDMMTCSRDTFSLAYIRQPLLDIYTAIKTSYYSAVIPDQISVFVNITLNSQQLAKIKETAPEQFIYFSTFLRCSSDPSPPVRNHNEYKFKILLSGRRADNQCPGFYCLQKDKAVILNIGNVFEVLAIDHKSRDIILRLVHLPQCNFDTKDKYFNLQLHRKYINYLVRMIPGQILAACFNKQLERYEWFVQNQLSLLNSGSNVDMILRKIERKLSFVKIQVHFRIESDSKIIRELTEAKRLTNELTSQHNPKVYKTKIYLQLAEAYLKIRDFVKVGKCLFKANDFLSENRTLFSDEDILKLKVFTICNYVQTQKGEIEQNLDKLVELHKECSQKLKQYSPVTLLQTMVNHYKIKCFEQLQTYSLAFKQIDSILSLIRVCQGQNQIYQSHLNLREEIALREKQLKNSRQSEVRMQKKTSRVDIEGLLEFGDFSLDLNDVDLSLYDGHDV